jgi:hypothetical protein
VCMQTRYVLGDAGRSLLTGYGKNPPTHVQNEAASCPPLPIACNAVSAQLSPDPNPNTLNGALVEGPNFSDTFQVLAATPPRSWLRGLCVGAPSEPIRASYRQSQEYWHHLLRPK